MGRADLRFFVTGGAAHGFGHLSRVSILAREAQRQGLRCAFSLQGDASAERFLRKRCGAVDITAWRATTVGGGEPYAVFDTREPIARELDALRPTARRRLVLDRLDALDLADLTVLPVLHAAPVAHPRLSSGGPYCIVDEVFRREVANLPAPRERNAVLVSLGGADPHDITRAVARPLERALDITGSAALEVHVVLGPGYRPSASRLAPSWRIHRSLEARDMAALMRQARLAIVGFGTTLLELAVMGVPSLYLTHHTSDVEAALRLEGRGIGGFAGHGPDAEPRALEAVLRRVLSDEAWRGRSAAAAARAVGDGGGALRVLELLLEDRPLHSHHGATAAPPAPPH